MTQTYLSPADMQSVMVHDVSYQRAIRLLSENWDTQENHLFSDLIKTSDVVWARKLQTAKLIKGKRDFTQYKDVRQFIVAHDEWLTPAAKRELLSSFD